MSTNHRYLPIVIAVIGEQRKLGVGDYRFARLIGVSQPYWHRLKHGQRSAGDDFLRGVVLRYPHLATMIAEIDSAAQCAQPA